MTQGRDLRLGIAGTLVAAASWGAAGVLVKSIDMNGLAVGFWRFLLYAAGLVAWMACRGRRLGRSTLRSTLLGGICLGLDVVLFFTAVKHTTIVNATTIAALQPVLVAVIAWRLFGERITMRDVCAGMVAIAGVIVIVVSSAGTPEWSGAGDIAAIGSLFAWTGYFVFAKRTKLPSLDYTAGTATWTALVCLLIGVIARQDMAPPSNQDDWVLLIALTLSGGVLGHSVMNWSLTRVPLWLGSALTLLIPVFSSIAAWLVLDEALTPVQVAAMATVVGALTMIVIGQRSPEPVRDPADALDTAAQ